MSRRRVLILGCDGLRPDLVTPELMPACSRLRSEGMAFTRFHAAYPSETRVSMTTLTTGVYPGKHGVVANRLYIPGFRDNGQLQTGDHQHLAEYTAWSGEPFILRPTLGDRLHRAGRHLAVAHSGSPGSSLLWNIRHPEKVININTDYGVPEMEEIHRRIAPAPDRSLWRERIEWTVKGLLDIHLPDPDNEVLLLWLYEPDMAFHYSGIGSPQACETLRWVDGCVARVLEALERHEDSFDVLLISDHGHSTIDAQGSLGAHVANACQELGIDVPFDATDKHLHNKAPIDDGALEKLVAWLKSQPWCGALCVRHEKAEAWGALPVETLYGPLHHGRAPLIIVNPVWSPECNEFGVPGVVKVLTDSAQKATHGNAVATDMRALCVGYGPSFRKHTVSEVPCGIVDIAPTVCHLLGLKEESGFDGRILHEGLSEGLSDGSSAPIRSDVYKVGFNTQRQPISVAEVNGTRYILGVE
jgi:predicted AlkP superfamily pyrophosphatase or phosphodiesterase